MRDTPSQRLRNARKMAGYKSASAAARAYGWQDSAYRHHENGTRNFGIEHATEYGRVFNVSGSWLLGLTENPLRKDVEEFVEEHRLPLLSQDLRDSFDEIERKCGIKFIPEVKFEDGMIRPLVEESSDGRGPVYHALHRATLSDLVPTEHFGELVFIRMVDRSMATTIEVGDLLLVDASERVISQQDAIWVLFLRDAAMVRRVRVLDGDTLQLMPESSLIAAQEVSRARIDLLGRVVWFGRPV